MALGVSSKEIVESKEFPLLVKHESWQRVHLSEIAEVQNGFAFSSDYFTKDEGMPLIRIRDIDKGKTENYFSGDYPKEFLVNNGDILVGMDGDFNLAIWRGLDGLLNQRVCRIIHNSELYDKRFLIHCLPPFLNAINTKTSSVTVKHLSSNTIKGIPLPLPPLPEQHRIVAKLKELFSSLDKGIESLKTSQQQLKVYRQAVLKWAFDGKLTNENVVDGELLEGWKSLKLRDITTEKDGLRRGPFGSAIKKAFFVDSGFKVYEQGNAINDDPYRGKYFINESKYQELVNFRVLPGDLIVSCSGVTLGRISEIPIGAKPGVINQALLRIRLRHNFISNKFFVLYFRSSFFQKKIFDQSQGTAMPNLVGIKDFKEIELLIPPLPQQHAIVAEIESRLSVCDKIEDSIEQSLKQAESLRQSILKKAFEGKLVPQDHNDEPASVLLDRIRKERSELPSTKAKARRRK